MRGEEDWAWVGRLWICDLRFSIDYVEWWSGFTKGYAETSEATPGQVAGEVGGTRRGMGTGHL